jgi:hypothetical protein
VANVGFVAEASCVLFLFGRGVLSSSSHFAVGRSLQEFPVLLAKVTGGLEPTKMFPATFGHLRRKNLPKKY